MWMLLCILSVVVHINSQETDYDNTSDEMKVVKK